MELTSKRCLQEIKEEMRTDVNSVFESGRGVSADGDEGEPLGLRHRSLPAGRGLATGRLPPGGLLDDRGGSHGEPGGLDEQSGGRRGHPLLNESQRQRGAYVGEQTRLSSKDSCNRAWV